MSGQKNFFPSLALERLEEVIKRSLEYRSQLDKENKNYFNKILDAFLSIRGFRHPHDAPDYLLISEIKKCVRNHVIYEPLFHTIFKIWMISHSELYQLLNNHLQEKEFDSTSENNIPLEESAVFAVTEQFVRKHPQYPPHDVQLMYQFLASGLHLDPETGEEMPPQEKNEGMEEKTDLTGVNSGLWRTWLRDLEDLPAHAPEWEEFDAFISAARQIAELKDSERQQLSRIAALTEALEKLKTEATETILFFGFSDIVTWDAQAIPPETAASLADRVQDLSQKLLRHQDLVRQTPRSVAEAQKQRAALTELEQEIMTLKEALSQAFSPTPDLQEKPAQEALPLPSEVEGEEKVA